MGKKFAYLKVHSHPINASIVQTLTENFPGFQIDVIDFGQLIKSQKTLVLANVFSVFREYGLEILLGRKRISWRRWLERLLRTTHNQGILGDPAKT